MCCADAGISSSMLCAIQVFLVELIKLGSGYKLGSPRVYPHLFFAAETPTVHPLKLQRRPWLTLADNMQKSPSTLM